MSRMFTQKRKPRSHRVAVLAALLALVGVAWLIGLIGFSRLIPEQVDDTTSKTDAIVVLTGGTERLDAGLMLLQQGLGDKLFVSGVYRGVDVKQLLDLSRQAPEDLACCIEPGHSAANTEGNAEETADWIKVNGYTSLRLVTASYHMPRSLLEFRHLMPKITIIPHPVFPEHVKQERWWAWPGTASLIIGEYNKVLFAWARQQLETLSKPLPAGGTR